MHTTASLFSTIDELGPGTLIADPSVTTCLCLPPFFVIQVVEGSLYIPIKFLSTLLVSDAYLFDNTINRLRPQTRTELGVGRNTIIRLFGALDTGDVLISAFLACMLLPGAPIFGSAEFYIGQFNLQPFYDQN